MHRRACGCFENHDANYLCVSFTHKTKSRNRPPPRLAWQRNASIRRRNSIRGAGTTRKRLLTKHCLSTFVVTWIDTKMKNDIKYIKLTNTPLPILPPHTTTISCTTITRRTCQLVVSSFSFKNLINVFGQTSLVPAPTCHAEMLKNSALFVIRFTEHR